MVKQWLAEYTTGISGSSPHIARIRQHRLNSLRRWRVAEIISVLPVLLQIALALFFSGVLVLLWHLNHTVAIVATILIGALFVVTLVTTVLPAFSCDCCYISPPAIGLAFASLSLFHCLLRNCRNIAVRVYCAVPGGHWAKNAAWKVYIYMNQAASAALTIRGKELKAVSDDQERLDADMATTAFTTTLDPRNITASMPIVTMLKLKHASRYFWQIKAELTRHQQWVRVHEQVPCHVLSSGLLAIMAATVKDDIPDTDTADWEDKLERSLRNYPERNTGPSDMCMDLVSLAQDVINQDPGSQYRSTLRDLCWSLEDVIDKNMKMLSAQAGMRGEQQLEF